MLKPNSQPAMTPNSVAPDDHQGSMPLYPDVSSRTRAVTGVDVRTLPAGTEVAMDTTNSHYRFVMLDDRGSRARLRGGRYFAHEAEGRIEGSTLGGSLLWLGWIGVGLSMELSVQGKRLDTSRVRSITISI